MKFPSSPIRIELPTIYGMKTVNCYLFLQPEPTLIDCGENTAESWLALNKGLADNNLTIHDIKKNLHYPCACRSYWYGRKNF